MNEMKVFDNKEFGQVRTVTIDGELWFVGKDVALALGYKDTKNALKAHVYEEDKKGWKITTSSGEQTMTIINKLGLYALTFGSKLESSKRFKHWVISEVLPSIQNLRGDSMIENIENSEIQTLTSMEVAQMVEKNHSKLLRDIRKYSEQLAEAKVGLGDFFSESIYLDSNNQSRPCYLVTKKGCEFIAHKLTGQKGTEFTARYINRFHEMENKIDGVAKLGISMAQMEKFLNFIESQQQFNEHQEKFNQMVIDKLENANCIKTHQIENETDDAISALIEEESEFQRRRKVMNRLVSKMAYACGWDRNFALHRLYKTLENVLNISLEYYLEIHQTETENVHAGTWEMITENDRLYKTAVKLCTNTINNMKC